MTTRWARVARGWAAATFAIAAAAASHMLAGGPAPTPFGLAVALVFAGMICTVIAGRTISLWRLGVGVGVSQALFHSVFGGMGAPIAAAHAHGSFEVGAFVTHAHSSMWIAHAIAGAITVIAFRNGEVAFWGILSTTRMLVVRLVTALVPVQHTPVRRAAPVPRLFSPLALSVALSPLRRRGPPAIVAA